MTKVKICGLRDLAEAVAAQEAGADYVGMVFVPDSRRRIQQHRAAGIVDGLRGVAGGKAPKFVGLFADQPLREVTEVAEALDLDILQLCGNEDLEYCAGVKRPVVKVLPVRSSLPRQQVLEDLDRELSSLEAQGHLAILDTYQEGVLGGTGRTFDWSIARELAQAHPSFLLAGGLTPENVGRAIRTVVPFGVDVSSGVETRGAKDPEKIRAFVESARRAERELGRNRLASRLKSSLPFGPWFGATL